MKQDAIELENEMLRYAPPKVKLDKVELAVDVYPFKLTESLLFVQNDGKTRVKAHFKDPHFEKIGEFPEWLSVTPSEFEIDRKDRSKRSVLLQFRFGNVPYNTYFKKGYYDYTLVLEIENGKVIFIPIRFTLRKTSFYKTITNLNMHPNGYLLEQPYKYTPLLIPKEIWRLCNYLFDNMKSDKKFSLNSLIFNGYSVYYDILVSLDNHREFNPSLNYNRVFEFLYLFLINLVDSIIPSHLYEQVVIHGDKQSNDMELFFKNFENEIPVENKNLFVYLIQFIKEILANNLTIDKREFVNFFSPCFIRTSDNTKRQCDSRAINNFLLHFINSKKVIQI